VVPFDLVVRLDRPPDDDRPDEDDLDDDGDDVRAILAVF